jgi:beta-ribofuranosylaminobenzene 5'-phosphate synthase
MNGSRTGRLDGGVGLMLRDPFIAIQVQKARASSVQLADAIPEESRAELRYGILALLDRLQTQPGLGPVKVEVESCPVAHAGLGAKTQLLLAVVTGTAKCYGTAVDADALANLSGRAGTSGIGLYGFLQGGFILDGGHQVEAKRGETIYRPSSYSQTAGPPPLLTRYSFPDWPVLLVSCPGHRIHGEWEAQLFREVCPVPNEEVQALCQTILMQLLPALVTQDLRSFGDALWDIQARRWKAFEIAAQTPAIGRIMSRVRHDLGVAGVGMSSWGTSIICVDERLSEADHLGLVADITDIAIAEAGSAEVILTNALNEPATVTTVI